jgi:hypothetical protein
MVIKRKLSRKIAKFNLLGLSQSYIMAFSSLLNRPNSKKETHNLELKIVLTYRVPEKTFRSMTCFEDWNAIEITGCEPAGSGWAP